MVGQFYSRKKTCRFQGRIKHGLTVCAKDGSIRHAAKCDKRHCPKWNRTPNYPGKSDSWRQNGMPL